MFSTEEQFRLDYHVHIRLGIGNRGIKDLARVKESSEIINKQTTMTVRAGRLLVNKQKFCPIFQAKRPSTVANRVQHVGVRLLGPTFHS